MLSPLETGTTRGDAGNVGGAGRPAPRAGTWHRRAARGAGKPASWPTWCGEAGQGPSISYMEGPCLILPAGDVFTRVGNPGNRGNADRDDMGFDRARARFSGGRAATGGGKRGSRRVGNRPVQDRRSANPQDWGAAPSRAETPPGSAPLRPLPAVNHLLNPVVDGDRRLPLRLVVVVAQAGTSVGGD